MGSSVEFRGWTWETSIGVLYGAGPNGERESVARPLMSSPWWVDSKSSQNEDYVPIYRTPRDAMNAVIDRRARADLPSREAWFIASHTPHVGRPPLVRHDQFPTKASAQAEADHFNEEEAENASTEMRKVQTHYYVVKATTTYEVA